MDNAATTKISKEVLNAMMPYLTDYYGNPSAQYEQGVNAKKAINLARERVANGIGAKPEEIYFTSCGSESNNWAIKGVCENQLLKGKNKIITTNIEHPSVLNTCKHLAKFGFEVVYVPVNKDGFVTADQIEDVIDDKTAIVSVMYANNEIGTIQPIKEIGIVCHKYGVPLHVDAVQAVGNIYIDVNTSLNTLYGSVEDDNPQYIESKCQPNVDLMSISGHKINAPKGIGCLYIRNGIECSPLIHGGGQESHMRSGTENVASIVGFGKAMEIATSSLDKKVKYVEYLRNYLIENIVDGDNIRLNGSLENRLCGNVNVSFKNNEGESIALQLASFGIYVSAKSACSAGSLEPSYVIKALGVDEEYLWGAVRFSLNGCNTYQEVNKVVKAIKEGLILHR